MMIDKRIKEEAGIAMITVVMLSAVLMMLGGGMYFVAARENRMTNADYVGGQAFYYAEGGIENVIDIINYAATDTQLRQQRPDQSLASDRGGTAGYGYLMAGTSEIRNDTTVSPADPVVMSIGNERYSVWVDTVWSDGTPCTDCGLRLGRTSSVNPAYLMITAEGTSAEGYRKLQQQVRVEASSYPMNLYIDGDVSIHGNNDLIDQSIYVTGKFYGRSMIDIAPGSIDLVYGGPAAVFSTMEIHDSQNINQQTQIYTPSGGTSSYFQSPDYDNDRDSRGGLNGGPFTGEDIAALFDQSGLSTSQLSTLKGAAKTSGYYADLDCGSIVLQQKDLPVYDGQDIVIYLEYPSNCPVNQQTITTQFSWPNPYSETAPGQAIVVVRYGSVSMNGQTNINGSIYAREGELKTTGNGGSERGQFVGFIWGEGLDSDGNFDFSMNQYFLDHAPFFTWTVVREAAWAEIEDADS